MHLEFQRRSVTGSVLHGRLDDFFAHRFAAQGYYNWRLWACAVAVCSRGDTIIEIGANVGTETIGYSDYVGPEGTVHAFEAFPPNVDRLQRALASIAHDNVRIHPVAIAASRGTLAFSPPPPDNSGTGHIDFDSGHPTTSQHDQDSMEVEAVSLDELSDQLGRASFIVIDAEGSEISILQGARSYLERCRPVVALEADGRNNLPRNGFSLEDLHQELTSSRYEVFDLGRAGLRPVRYGHIATDWVAVPIEHASETSAAISSTLARSALLPFIGTLNPLRRGPRT
jgi:FkbM family methyltransferase